MTQSVNGMGNGIKNKILKTPTISVSRIDEGMEPTWNEKILAI